MSHALLQVWASGSPTGPNHTPHTPEQSCGLSSASLRISSQHWLCWLSAKHRVTPKKRGGPASDRRPLAADRQTILTCHRLRRPHREHWERKPDRNSSLLPHTYWA